MATFWPPVAPYVIFLRSRMLGERAETDLGFPGDPPGTDFGRIFGDSLHRFGHSWRPRFVTIASQVCPNFKSVVVLPSVPRRALPAFGCRCDDRAERAK